MPEPIAERLHRVEEEIANLRTELQAAASVGDEWQASEIGDATEGALDVLTGIHGAWLEDVYGALRSTPASELERAVSNVNDIMFRANDLYNWLVNMPPEEPCACGRRM